MGAKILFKLFGGFRGNNFKSLGSEKKLKKNSPTFPGGIFFKEGEFLGDVKMFLNCLLTVHYQ